ncbi:plasmid recombination protein [Frigidibacter sp. MR17.24]|uniref:plasmid recombination protein n=1 Tax=Frigidibacter sp. MR17.24 TaxID=3127345 RepID=UPI003012E205
MARSAPARYPVVLRFAAISAAKLSRYRLHEERLGRGSLHCDPTRTHLNRRLIGPADWIGPLLTEIDVVRGENLVAEIEALKAQKRKSAAQRRYREGPADPWRADCEGGPMREVILTVNHRWFEGSDRPDDEKVDLTVKAQREAAFAARATDWLTRRFGACVVTARVDHDETAAHIHAVIVPWTEKTTGTRGRQRLIQPTSHPLLASYEKAQDDVGKFFEALGLTRGEPWIKAVAEAEARGADAPNTPQHVPPHVWRRQEELRQKKKAAELVEREKAAAEKEVALRQALSEQRERAQRQQLIDETWRKAKAKREAEVAARERQVRAAETVIEVVLGRPDVASLEAKPLAQAIVERSPDVRQEFKDQQALPIRLYQRMLALAQRLRADATARAERAQKIETAASRVLTEVARLKEALFAQLPPPLREKLKTAVATEHRAVTSAETDLQVALGLKPASEPATDRPEAPLAKNPAPGRFRKPGDDRT